MALNRQTLKTRTITAIVFAIVMLVGLLWNQWSFLALFTIIHFGCWWEYFKLIEKIHKTIFHIYTKLGLMMMGYALVMWFCAPEIFSINGYSLKANLPLSVSLAGFVVLVLGIFQKEAVRMNAFVMAFAGIFYISLSCGLMLYLYNYSAPIHNSGNTQYLFPLGIVPILIIVSIWINDTMAYIVGSLVGKRPLTKISPKKTWEGTIGGILLSVIVVVTTIFLSKPSSLVGNFNIIFCAVLALVVAITGTLGDLFESKLKRMADVKDSGSFMPGHGGFLDRFDSLLFAIPFAATWTLFA